jgi:hypothetical protein
MWDCWSVFWDPPQKVFILPNKEIRYNVSWLAGYFWLKDPSRVAGEERQWFSCFLTYYIVEEGGGVGSTVRA